jgi:hypothetical protein
LSEPQQAALTEFRTTFAEVFPVSYRTKLDGATKLYIDLRVIKDSFLSLKKRDMSAYTANGGKKLYQKLNAAKVFDIEGGRIEFGIPVLEGDGPKRRRDEDDVDGNGDDGNPTTPAAATTDTPMELSEESASVVPRRTVSTRPSVVPAKASGGKSKTRLEEAIREMIRINAEKRAARTSAIVVE